MAQGTIYKTKRFDVYSVLVEYPSFFLRGTQRYQGTEAEFIPCLIFLPKVEYLYSAIPINKEHIFKRGASQTEAHQQTLIEQGQNFNWSERLRYTQDALDASNKAFE